MNVDVPGAADRAANLGSAQAAGPGVARTPGETAAQGDPWATRAPAPSSADGAAGAERPAPKVTGYEILGELGRGGMGVVYKARQLKLNRLVALKMILAGAHAGSEELTRFRTEAEAVASLQHPNIVQIYEVGEQDGLPFFALELVDGGSLSQRLAASEAMAPRSAAELLLTLTLAMHAAHQRGIIHRDLKPDNILITRDGRPVITDFGLAKRLNSRDGYTQTGSIFGTPAYMAPEQAVGNTRAVGVLADVYALGAIFFELLTRRPPFCADTPLETMRQVVEDEPAPPARFNPQVPRDLETICLKCLAKDPDKRYASCEALADDLQRYLHDEPILARPVGAVERTVKWMRRHPALTVLVVFLQVGLTLGVAGAVAYHLNLQEAYEELRKALARAESASAAEVRAKQEVEVRLIDMMIVNGQKQADAGDLLGSLPWLVRALQMEEQANPADAEGQKLQRQRSAAQRVRLGSVLDQCPRMQHLLFHPARVNWAAFSPDGRLILTACADGNVRLWDADTGAAVGTPLEHPLPPERLAGGNVILHADFSPDGERIVTASKDHTARIWEVKSRKFLILQHQGAVNFAAFSPEGQRVVTASADKTAQVWEAATGAKIGGALHHEGNVHRAAFSPQGDLLATASDDASARLWDPVTGAALRKLQHRAAVYCVAFSANGKSLATASADSTAGLWRVDSDQPVHTLRHTAPVLFVAYPDVRHRPEKWEKYVVTAGEDNCAHVWNTETGERIGAPLQHASTVYTVAFGVHPHTNRLLITTASDDNTARVWDAFAGADDPPPVHHNDKTVRVWNALGVAPPLVHNGTVCRAVFHPTQPRLLTACNDGTARVWVPSVNFNKMLHPTRDDGPVTAATFSRNGRLALTATSNGTARLWDAESGHLELPDAARTALAVHALLATVAQQHQAIMAAPTEVLAGQHRRKHQGRIYAAIFSPDPQSRYFATAGADKAARLWDTASGRQVGKDMVHDGEVRDVAFSPDGKRLVTASADGTVRLWDVPPDQPLADFKGHRGHVVHSAAFSPDNQLIVTASSDHTARIWRAANPEGPPRILRHDDEIYQACFSPDGSRVATASADGTACIWDPEDGKRVCKPLRHNGKVYSAIFDMEDMKGARVLTASNDNTARVWDAATGEPLTPPAYHGGAVLRTAFKASRVATASADNTARVWSADTGAPLTRPLAHRASVEAVAFSPNDNGVLLTGSSDRTAQIWMMPPTTYAIDDLVLIAKLSSGHWVDQTAVGALGITRLGIVALPTRELEVLWNKGKQLYADPRE